MSRLTLPPAYVPTLTEVIHPAPAHQMAEGSDTAGKKNAPDIQELIVQRVLRRLDGTLEKRVHEACTQLILQHTQALVPQLLDAMEAVVRSSVEAALAHELQAALQDSASEEPQSAQPL